MLYVEPTPYILGLIRCISASSPFCTEVGFTAENLSQQWNLPLSGADAFVLPKGALAASLAVSRRLLSGRYCLLHLAGWGGAALKMALLWSWVLRIPAVLESDTPLTAHTSLWKRVVKRAVYPLMFGIPRRFLPGGSLQRDYLKHYGVPEDRISIAGMTVDVAAILKQSGELAKLGSRAGFRSRCGIVDGHAVFIFVGRLEPHKGIADLLRAFSMLSASRSDTNLLIAGEGSERPSVEAAAKSNPAIKYLGRLVGQEVIEAMDSADVAVLPSTFEPWGLVVNEAMAAGLTVIASDRVGCRADLVRHEQTGLVFAAGSAERLRDAMEYLADNPGDRKRMAVRARVLINDWTLENWARNIAQAWELRMSNENPRY